MEWQPIETGPQDGTMVLLAEVHLGMVTVGRWLLRGSRLTGNGWYRLEDRRGPLEPTHWMPLPQPPRA